MKKLVLLHVLICLISMNLLAQKTEKDLILIKTFADGSYPRVDERDTVAPWFFSEENRLYTVTPDRREYRIYNSRFELEQKNITPNAVFSGGGGLKFPGSMYFYTDGFVQVLQMQGKDYPFSWRSEDPRDLGGFLFGNIFVSNSKYPDYNPYGFLMPPEPTGSVVRIPHEEFMKKLANGDFAYTGLSFKDGMVLYKGLPFFKEDMKKIWGHDINFSGWDKDWNYLGSRVYDRNGNLLVTIFLSEGSDLSGNEYTPRFFDYEGNFYTFKGNNLYYIGRDWGFVNVRDGIMNDGGVRVRLHPGTSELILGQVEKGSIVKILEETAEKQTIGGQTASWYKVKLTNGLIGWVFGAFVDIQN